MVILLQQKNFGPIVIYFVLGTLLIVARLTYSLTKTLLIAARLTCSRFWAEAGSFGETVNKIVLPRDGPNR